MKKRFEVFVILGGTGRIIEVEAYTPSQALSLARMQATKEEVKDADFVIATPIGAC